MPLDAKEAKSLVINALSHSKLKELASVIERAQFVGTYTNYQYSNEPELYIQTNEGWVAALLLCVGYGLLSEFPERHPAPPSVISSKQSPYVLVASTLTDPIYTHRKIEYDSATIKTILEGSLA